jgi:hypothetical protein
MQAYIKRRRLPVVKKDDDHDGTVKSGVNHHNVKSNDKIVNGKGNGKAEKENRGVGKIITNIMTNASAACYIGQNGLYQSNGKAKGTDSCKSKMYSNGQANGQKNEYSSGEKKHL